jgi:hypothetical protein
MGILWLKYQQVLRNYQLDLLMSIYRSLFVAAFDVESPASYLITVPFPKA